MRFGKSLATVLLLGSNLSAMPAAVKEGMFTPDQLPEIADNLKDTGFELDAAKLAGLTGFSMDAIGSLGGYSASLVSPHGLVVTNHQCADRGIGGRGGAGFLV